MKEVIMSVILNSNIQYVKILYNSIKRLGNVAFSKGPSTNHFEYFPQVLT